MVYIHRVADEKLFKQLDGVGLLSACGLDEAGEPPKTCLTYACQLN